jgi:hypothetical protein
VTRLKGYRHALEAGLSPEQVLQLQDFSKKLRSGLDVTIQKESAVIGDMRKRMIVLEERLAKALAFGDLPKHMQGMLPTSQKRFHWSSTSCTSASVLSQIWERWVTLTEILSSDSAQFK